MSVSEMVVAQNQTGEENAFPFLSYSLDSRMRIGVPPGEEDSGRCHITRPPLLF